MEKYKIKHRKKVTPQTGAWRQGVGAVLQALGQGIDYEAMERRAAEACAPLQDGFPRSQRPKGNRC